MYTLQTDSIGDYEVHDDKNDAIAVFKNGNHAREFVDMKNGDGDDVVSKLAVNVFMNTVNKRSVVEIERGLERYAAECVDTADTLIRCEGIMVKGDEK